ncbi:unnamed protein product [marine sediment metagenome]|uniref:Uncharacterized protein n=1 Tax=marine sediment metagenome TaxID=412755 RepID=X0W5A8_9ZZZZ
MNRKVSGSEYNRLERWAQTWMKRACKELEVAEAVIEHIIKKIDLCDMIHDEGNNFLLTFTREELAQIILASLLLKERDKEEKKNEDPDSV